MCGRFVSASPPDEIARYFDAVPAPAEQVLEANYNVAPTDDVYVVLESGGVRRVEALRWGLVPWWAASPAVGSRMINARAESLAEKNAFKPAFEKRRCIIPADGFYEWQKIDGRKAKQPVYVHRPDGEPLAFAGLWEVWRDPNDRDRGALHTCTIITTSANETMAPVHDRMPVILPPEAWDEWLDAAHEDIDLLGKLLVPAPARLIRLHPVSTDVNSVRNQGAALIERVEPVTGELREQGTLL
jgi:putative SOS response-associated peptidase YedK